VLGGISGGYQNSLGGGGLHEKVIGPFPHGFDCGGHGALVRYYHHFRRGGFGADTCQCFEPLLIRQIQIEQYNFKIVIGQRGEGFSAVADQLDRKALSR
jgi:hypothetical protein